MEMWILATVVLIVGMVDDLRSRKVHNILVLGLLVLSLAGSLYFRGLGGSSIGLAALISALIFTLPLFALRILGGGDVKLFAVFALCLDPMSTFWTLIYSFIWGAVFGVTRAALQKNLLALVRSTYRVTQRSKIQVQEIHKIPYTFSLLLGWFTQLTLLHAGGFL